MQEKSASLVKLEEQIEGLKNAKVSHHPKV